MSAAFAPSSWAEPGSGRSSGAAVVVAVTYLIVGFVIASIGFAMPMALRLIDGGHAVVGPSDAVLLRAMAGDGGIITAVGIVHALLGLSVLSGRRVARLATAVLAGSGIVVGVVGFAATVAAWGPFAGTALARPGSPRMDGLGITLATILVETVVLLALRSADRAARATV